MGYATVFSIDETSCLRAGESDAEFAGILGDQVEALTSSFSVELPGSPLARGLGTHHSSAAAGITLTAGGGAWEVATGILTEEWLNICLAADTSAAQWLAPLSGSAQAALGRTYASAGALPPHILERLQPSPGALGVYQIYHDALGHSRPEELGEAILACATGGHESARVGSHANAVTRIGRVGVISPETSLSIVWWGNRAWRCADLVYDAAPELAERFRGDVSRRSIFS